MRLHLHHTNQSKLHHSDLSVLSPDLYDYKYLYVLLIY